MPLLVINLLVCVYLKGIPVCVLRIMSDKHFHNGKNICAGVGVISLAPAAHIGRSFRKDGGNWRK